MKKLQNNFTTPEQSKKLLELGVPAWTANIMFDINRRRYELIDTEDESLAETQRTLFYNGGAIPHWSACRLMEIYEICTGETFERNYVRHIFSDIFITIKSALSYHKMNFSKLEE